MRLDEVLARRLAAETASELESLSLIEQDLADAPRHGDTLTLRGRGSILHDFYSGAERIFVRIAEELERRRSQGQEWHRQPILE